MNAAVLRIREEGNAIVRAIAKSEPAKVIAFKAAISPRHVYNLREDEIGQPDLAWPNFILLAQQVPELRKKVMEWFEADNGSGDDPAKLASDIVQFLQSRGKG